MVIFGYMMVLKRIFAFYINSSIHVALAVVSLLAISVLEYGLRLRWEVWAFVFLGALTGYNFVKYAKVAGLHHRSLTNSLRTIQVFSAACFAVLAIIALRLSIYVLLITAGFGMATFLYAVPFLHSKNLRNFSGVKIFVVAFVWAGVTVIVPVAASQIPFSWDIFFTFLQRILIVVALILPFEIRDVPYDSLNLKTLPQLVGVRNTKLIGLAVLLACLGFEFFKIEVAAAYIVSLLLFSVALGWLLVISKPHQNRYFSSFWVEGLPILWLIVYLLLARI